MQKIIIAVVFMLFSEMSFSQKMDNQKLHKILQTVSDSIDGNDGYWQFKYETTWMLMITDQKNNRMRIILPIVDVKQLNEKYLTNALEANFHSALDVKYAISDGYIWSVFIHPLKELSANQVKDAFKQVYYAAATFGGSYSSTELVFPKKD
jgi:hypothetical protein